MLTGGGWGGRSRAANTWRASLPTAGELGGGSTWAPAPASLRVPEASRGRQEGLPGRGGIFQLGSALAGWPRASQGTGMRNSRKGGPYQYHWLGCTPCAVALGPGKPEEAVTWDVDHAALDVCNYSLLTCNYSRNRYLSTGLLYIT